MNPKTDTNCQIASFRRSACRDIPQAETKQKKTAKKGFYYGFNSSFLKKNYRGAHAEGC